MRGLLIVNPNATSTTARRLDVIEHAFESEMDLEVAVTQYRGHARELARDARMAAFHTVLILGGDGTVNEAVNGLLQDGEGSDVPALATIPGGSANVFVRALGLPTDPIEATGALLESIRLGRTRSVGLGRANERWFTSNAGLGLDADVIVDMERQREAGRRATPSRYVRTTLVQYLKHTDRRHPTLQIRAGSDPRDGESAASEHSENEAATEALGAGDAVFLVIVQNASPWTYLGPLPLNANPAADFESGLSVFAPRRLGIYSTVRHLARIARSGTPQNGRDQVAWTDMRELEVVADPPAKLQVDGDAVGDFRQVRFTSVARALRVYY